MPQVETELRVAGIDPARVADVEARLAAIADEDERMAVAQSYPTGSSSAWSPSAARDDAEKLLAAMNRRAPLTARANRLKNTREELAARPGRRERRDASRRRSRPTGSISLTHVNAYGLQAFQDGRFELQDAGRQASPSWSRRRRAAWWSTPAPAPAARRSRSARCSATAAG